MTTFAIIGAGRLGTSLGFILTRRGWILKAVADRDPAAARESRRIIGRGTATTEIARAGRAARVLFICVPDDAVAGIARKLARPDMDWSGRFVFHTSGLLAASALDPLKRRGALTASLHPVRSFPRKEKAGRLFKGVSWAIEGDEQAVKTAREIVRITGGQVFHIAEKDKPLYHAACSLASNGFVALEGAASAILQTLGFSSRRAMSILLPLVQGTLQNVKDFGPETALTGPLSRGDALTVRRHLEALKQYPLEREIYRVLALRALDKVAKRKLPAGKVRALKRLLAGK